MSYIPEQALTAKIAQLSVPSRLGAKTSLEPIAELLDRLGHPERGFPAIHIGGTSGKGSTSTYLASILSAAGYKVGLYTKPHLQSVRERFVINGELIAPEAMMALLERIQGVMGEKPTWFELTTALAFAYFAEQRVDFGVIEVGLGGMLDATNVISPRLAILTNVGLDHTEILGDTVEKIAADKVGIFKPGRPVISGVTQPGVIEIVTERACELGAPLSLLNRDFYAKNVELSPRGACFDFEMGNLVMLGLNITMPGRHQVTNAALAAAAALRLTQDGAAITAQAIRAGLANTRVPGRMETIHENGAGTVIVLDGAHSPPKMQALVEGLRSLFAGKRRRIGVLSFSKGHDAAASLALLAPLLDQAVITEFCAETDYGNKRAQERAEVAAALKEQNPAVQVTLEAEPARAIDTARGLAGPEDLIVVTGSIFLVGQVREVLLNHKKDGE